jgi:hypothetical protein
LIETRIYRAALLPALLAVLVAMFAVESRPSPLPRGLPADELFDPARALGDAERILAAQRSRARGERDAPTLVAEAFAAGGFETRVDRFEAEGETLANVAARRPGTDTSAGEIVIVAERDAAGRGGAVRAAADTGGLLELARSLEGRALRRTLTLVSLGGGRLDEAGARRLAERLEPERVAAVLAVSSLGGRGELEASVVPWSNSSTRAGQRLERTAGDAVRQELGRLPGQETAPAQLVRLAFPLGIGAQGVMLGDGLQSVRFSGSGETPSSETDLGQIDRARFGSLGRAVLRAVSALDGRGLTVAEPPAAYLTGPRQVIPGWSVALLGAALLLPALVTVADGFARVGRRRGGVGAWVLWTLAGALPFAGAVLLLRLLDLVGAVPGMVAAVAPAAEPVTLAGIVLLVALALLTGAGWWFGRRAVLRRLEGLSRPSEPGAGAAVALVTCVGVVAVWALDPFAALLLVPAVHLWSMAAIGARPRIGLALAMAGLVLPLATAVFYLERLSLDPLGGLWYWTLIVAGGEVGVAAALLTCVLAGAFLSLLAVLASRAGEEASSPPPHRSDGRIRGPVTYAGPGSLGGTRSALRR